MTFTKIQYFIFGLVFALLISYFFLAYAQTELDANQTPIVGEINSENLENASSSLHIPQIETIITEVEKSFTEKLYESEYRRNELEILISKYAKLLDTLSCNNK